MIDGVIVSVFECYLIGCCSMELQYEGDILYISAT